MTKKETVSIDNSYVPYEQKYCPSCGGSINTGFRCTKCGKQYHPKSNNSSVTKAD